MSVFVDSFKDNPGGAWKVVHDDAPGGAHEGLVDPATLTFSDFRRLLITCPVCGAVSSHPVGGGAQPRPVQEMFLRTLLRPGRVCPCGQLPAGRALVLVLGHLRGHADQMDGAGRWRITSGGFEL